VSELDDTLKAPDQHDQQQSPESQQQLLTKTKHAFLPGGLACFLIIQTISSMKLLAPFISGVMSALLCHFEGVFTTEKSEDPSLRSGHGFLPAVEMTLLD